MTSRFRPGLVPTLAAAAAVLVLCGLGAWQLRRHEWKQALIAEGTARLRAPVVDIRAALADPPAHEWRRARVRGHYDHAQTVLLLHVQRELQDGARVLTPLRLAGDQAAGPALLVDRGWIPASEVEGFLAGDSESGLVTVAGVLRRVEFGEAAELPSPARRVAWHRLQPRALQGQLPYPLAGVLLLRGDDGSGQLPLGGFEPPRSRVDHRSYAVTWFAMAAIAIATWIGLGLKQAREDPGLRPPAPPA